MPIIMMAAIAVLEVKMQASGSHQTCFVYFAKRERDSNSSTSCEALTRHYLGQIPLPPTPAINMYRRLQCNIKAKISQHLISQPIPFSVCSNFLSLSRRTSTLKYHVPLKPHGLHAHLNPVWDLIRIMRWDS